MRRAINTEICHYPLQQARLEARRNGYVTGSAMANVRILAANVGKTVEVLHLEAVAQLAGSRLPTMLFWYTHDDRSLFWRCRWWICFGRLPTDEENRVMPRSGLATPRPGGWLWPVHIGGLDHCWEDPPEDYS